MYQIIFLGKQPIANFGCLKDLVIFMKPESLEEGSGLSKKKLATNFKKENEPIETWAQKKPGASNSMATQTFQL